MATKKSKKADVVVNDEVKTGEKITPATSKKETNNKSQDIFGCDAYELTVDGYEFSSLQEMEKYQGYVKRFSEYSFLNLSGKPVITKQAYNSAGLIYEFSSPADFHGFHKEEHFFAVNGKKIEKIYFSKEWIENKNLRTRYDSTTFDTSPEGTPPNVFNFWTGYVEPKEGDVTPFLNHINNLIIGTQEHKDHLIKLLAYTVRFPHIQAGTSIALRGKQGSGKTTVSMVLKAICPNHCKIIDDIENLFGFNAETVHVKYFLCEESVWGGEKSKENKLKNLITCDSRSINIKNLNGLDIKNYGFYIFTSNSDWMIPVGPNDRRFNIFDCADTYIDNRTYFNEFYTWLHGDGKNFIMDYFLNKIDLTGFEPRNTISTDAKTDLKKLSLDAIDKFIFNILSSEIDFEPIEVQGWHDEIRLVRKDFFEFFKKSTSTNRVEQGEFSRKLAEIFGFPQKWQDNWKQRIEGSGTTGIYKLPSKKECRVLFAKHIKENPEQLFAGYIAPVVIPPEVDAKQKAGPGWPKTVSESFIQLEPKKPVQVESKPVVDPVKTVIEPVKIAPTSTNTLGSQYKRVKVEQKENKPLAFGFRNVLITENSDA